MTFSVCTERAMNLSSPHWGPWPPLPDNSDGSAFGREGSGPWHAETIPPDGPDQPLSFHVSTPGEPKGFEFTNITYREVCASSTLGVPNHGENAATLTSATVINVTAITNSNAAHSLVMQMESCDGATSLKTTKPGVFVVPGAAAAVFIERWYAPGQNKTDGCPGESFIAFTSATLEDYCKVDGSLAECKKASPSVRTSHATTTKRSFAIAAVGILATFVTTLA